MTSAPASTPSESTTISALTASGVFQFGEAARRVRARGAAAQAPVLLGVQRSAAQRTGFDGGIGGGAGAGTPPPSPAGAAGALLTAP